MKVKLQFLILLFSVSLFSQQSGLVIMNSCNGSPINLEQVKPQLLGGLNPNTTIISYFLTSSDAINNTNPILNPTAFIPNPNNGNIIYVRILNQIDNSITYNNITILDLPLVISTNISNITCFGGNNGAITVNVTGGSPPYIYTLISQSVTVSSATNNTITGLLAGVYTISVTDSNGCTTQKTVVLTQQVPLIGSSLVTGDTVTINASGGTPPYVYSLNGGPYTNATGTFGGLQSGVYVYQIQDVLGCTFTGTFNIGMDINLAVIASYNDFNNDGFINVGDVINYQFNVSNPNTTSVLNDISVYNSNGLVTISGNPIASLAPGTSNNSNFSGVYVINQQDLSNGYIIKNFSAHGTILGQQVSTQNAVNTPLGTSNGFKLIAFVDTNGNNIKDNNEQNIVGGNFVYQVNNGTPINIYSSNGISYVYENNPNIPYNFSYVLPNEINCNYNSSFVPINYNNVTITGNGITTYNFPIPLAQGVCNDLEVNLFNNGSPRPGFSYFNIIKYKNNGNTTVSSGTITFTKDNIFSIISTNPSTTSTANGFSYDFTNLQPGESRLVAVEMQVPTIPTVSLGQSTTNSVSISIPANDINVQNNASQLTSIIIGSYDPNDKQENHGPEIVKSTFGSNDYLTYKIRFENTGTAEAINVKVTDVLSNLLDPSTIKMVDASHPYVLYRNGNNLEWKFDGINLPPSVANTQIGHGYIIFQVKPMAGFDIGTEINNTANIYFDFNPAIVTNTTNTKFVAALSNENFLFENLKIYPNPTSDNLIIENAEKIDKIKIFDTLGKVIFNQDVNEFYSKINLKDISKGLYFIKVSIENKERIVKFVKI